MGVRMRRWILGGVLLILAVPAFGQFDTNGPAFNGARSVVDLPTSQHMRNTGGTDGLGLCVPTSIQHSARWHGLYELEGYRAYTERLPGGSYPSKVDATLKAFANSKGIRVPEYIQHTGGDDGFLDLAIRTGRCPGVTYGGKDGFYRSGIYHMVNLAHLDSDRAAIIDNNRPGYWVWMSRRDFLYRWRDMDGGWAVVFLGPPPPPYSSVPTSLRRCQCEPCECSDCPCGPKFGQCINGQCPTVSRPSPVTVTDGWERVQFADGEVVHKLFRGGRLIGVQAVDGWHPASGAGWTVQAVGSPPEQPPGDWPTGVVPNRVHDHPSYSLNGKPCSREEALARLGGLTDDSDRWNLAAVGDASFLARVRTDAAKLPEAVRGKLHIQTLPPDVWQVPTLRLGSGVTLRKPAVNRIGGEVGFVPAVDYSPDRLAALLSMPGGPVPSNHPTPTPTPDPVKPIDPTPEPKPEPVPMPDDGTRGLGWIVLLAGVLYLLFRKR